MTGIEAFENEDYATALELLLPLAEAGNARAQGCVGCMYHLGLGVPSDGRLAVKWYRKAAEQKEPEAGISAVAYNNLATIFVTGAPGVPADRPRARRYWRRAAELGFDMIPPSWYSDPDAD